MSIVPGFRTKFWGLGLSWAWIPLFGFLVASAMILSLLIIWLAQGHPRYKPDEATIVYISDVGAANHTLFIVLASISAVLYFWSLWMDYRLRHSQRIASRMRRFESWMAGCAIIAAFISAVNLILLSVYDAFNHDTTHWTCAVIFFIALIVSGVFNMAEIGGDQPLSHDYCFQHQRLSSTSCCTLYAVFFATSRSCPVKFSSTVVFRFVRSQIQSVLSLHIFAR